MSKLAFCTIIVALVLHCARPLAAQGGPSTTPVLRVETGMHQAQLWRLGVDASGHWLVSGSFDKTVRLWDLSTGGEVAVLRPPVGPGAYGMVCGVAISPDSQTIACGAVDWQGRAVIYFFGRASGAMLRQIGGLSAVPYDLAFSPDGQWLAAGLASNGGLRVIRVGDGAVVAQDAAAAETDGVDFNRAGNRLVTASLDGNVRLYEVASNGALRVLKAGRAPGGGAPYSARFSPDGRRIAVGFVQTPNVNVLSADDLHLLAAPAVNGVGGDLRCVAWSPDGRRLHAAGSSMMTGGYFLRTWDERGKPSDVVASGYIMRDLRTLPPSSGGLRGEVASGGSDPSIGIFDATGKRCHYRGPSFLDFYFAFRALQVSLDGTSIQFPLKQFGLDPAQFHLTGRTMSVGGAPVGILPRTKAPGLDIKNFEDANGTSLNGRPLGFAEGCRGLAITADAKRFVLGTDQFVRCFDSRGAALWQHAVTSAAWSVGVSGDGRLALATLQDGTIRWYRMRDGMELLAFFPCADRRRWIVWTPSGYYDCAGGAEDLIGWHLNRGAQQAADFFPASRFRGQFYRPDVIDRILVTLDEGEALRQADAASGRHDHPIAIESRLPPVVQILAPDDGTLLKSRQVTLRYNARSSAPISAVRVLVDGRPIEGGRDLVIVPRAGNTSEVTVTLPAQDCRVSIVAFNRFAASEPATVRLRYPNAPPATDRPALYVLAVGVSKYPRPDWALRYPSKDARDFSAAMSAQKGNLYRDVTVRLIVDGDATRNNILDGLDWVRKQAGAKDVAMVYMSGHGVNDVDGSYYFVPVDFDADKVLRSGVAGTDIRKALAQISGKAVFLFDTCYSGGVLGRRSVEATSVINELVSAENGTVVMAASSGRQVALEDAAWGNGAFTKALVEGLSGKADYSHNGRITVNMLDLYVSQRVPELTGGRQIPTSAKPAMVPDFALASVARHALGLDSMRARPSSTKRAVGSWDQIFWAVSAWRRAPARSL